MFPLEFPNARAVYDADSGGARYVVGAMMTPSHSRFGERLAASCRAHSLPLALFEVPFVHRSISRGGSDDLRYTKANFVHFLMQRCQCPILYLDADCEIVQSPSRIDELVAERVDFAIFNWLAEEHTEAYVQTDITLREGGGERLIRDRFYRFSHSIDVMSETQLLCSGAAQYYNNSSAARYLLAAWHAVIERAPGRADDKCLDFAFNNLPPVAPTLRAEWLDKSYARYAWWIYERPVIDHPEVPYSGKGFIPLDDLEGRRRIYTNELRNTQVSYVFPKDCLIDTETRRLLRLNGGAWHDAGAVAAPLWI